MRYRIGVVVFASLAVLCLARPSRAEQGAMAAGKSMEQAIFNGVPGLPTCTTGAVESGDPTKEPSIILAKGEKGCVIPWHWHTPIEHVMIVSGSARMEMKDGSAANLKAGGIAHPSGTHSFVPLSCGDGGADPRPKASRGLQEARERRADLGARPLLASAPASRV